MLEQYDLTIRRIFTIQNIFLQPQEITGGLFYKEFFDKYADILIGALLGIIISVSSFYLKSFIDRKKTRQSCKSRIKTLSYNLEYFYNKNELHRALHILDKISDSCHEMNLFKNQGCLDDFIKAKKLLLLDIDCNSGCSQFIEVYSEFHTKYIE